MLAPVAASSPMFALLALLALPAGPAPMGAPAPSAQPTAPAAPTAPATAPAAGPSATAAPSASPPPFDEAARRLWLGKRIDDLLAAPALGKSKVSLLVAESQTGRAVYARNEKLGLNVASNVKIVTAAAALAMLGPDFRWKTAVLARAPERGAFLGAGGDLEGDLFLRATGDPTLDARHLDALALDLAQLGLRRVRGALVVDDTYFGKVIMPPAFDQKTESASFRAPSSAASLTGNSVAVTVVPGAKAGAPARVLVEPPSAYAVVRGDITTVAQGPATFVVETAAEGDARTIVKVSGRVLLGAEPRTSYRRIEHPPLFLGHAFLRVLARRGIVVDRAVRIGVTPVDGMRALATHESTPLAIVIHDLGKHSVNFVAEQVLRTLGAEVQGAPGTFEKGLDAAARWLQSVGVTGGTYEMKNGSGLYDSNRFSAEQLVTVLRAAQRDFRIAPEFEAALSLAGADGTLAARMAGTKAERHVRGKTGTLATVSCLSGYAGRPGHAPLVFSILMNGVAAPEARRVQDEIAATLVEYLEPAP